MSKRKRTPPTEPRSAAQAESKRGIKLPDLNISVDSTALRRSLQFAGLGLFFFSAFTLLALISHLTHGPQDQSTMGHGLAPGFTGEPAANIGGALGAYLGRLLIADGFGFVALLLPVFTGLIGLSVLRPGLLRTAKSAFPYLFFATYWCAAAGDFFNRFFGLNMPTLGGKIGNSLNDWTIFYIGPFGLGIVLAFILAIFIVIRAQNGFPYLHFITDTLRRWLPAPAFAQARAGTTAKPEAGAAEAAESEHSENEPDDAAPDDGAGQESSEEDKPDEEFSISIRKMPVTPAGETASHPGQPAGERATVWNTHASAQMTEAEQNVMTPAAELDEDMDEIRLTKTDTDEHAETDGEVAFSIARGRGSAEDEEDSAEASLALSAETDLTTYATNVARRDAEGYELVIDEADQTSLADREDVSDWEEYDPMKCLSRYQYPSIELLEPHGANQAGEIDEEEVESNKNRIIQTFQDFKIKIVGIKATVGPTVTLYEIKPDRGIKVKKITDMQDDIALSLAATGVRIVGQIPGTNHIGIEIPNANPTVVSFRNVVATRRFRETDKDLPVILGRNISNEVVLADLTKMPHLLIAGATGQGKSVGLNCLIASILYKKHPSQIKFVMIDPKKVELAQFGQLVKHFMAKLPGCEETVITETADAVRVLNSLTIEMENRYDLFVQAKVKKLEEYNEKFRNRRLNPQEGHYFMPYIVVVLDELADLMQVSGKEAEGPLARLAAKSRATGIHLIAATQRPDTKVITGTIKNNFPTRISYKVTSQVDSRTILDQKGSERLVGKGDMLYAAAGSRLIRLQTPFIDNDEVDRLVEFIGHQQGYPEPYFLPEVPDENDTGEQGFDPSEVDDLFAEAAKLMVTNQSGSTSLLQRRFGIGYNRAGRIVDQLERAGIVGPQKGSKPREVFYPDDGSLEQYLNTLV